MGEEHDSWLEGLGFKFEPPDPDALVSGVKEAVKSELNVAQDLNQARGDAQNAARSEYLAKKEYLQAGVRDAIGDHEIAEDFRNSAATNEAEAKASLEAGKTELGKAENDAFGGDEDEQGDQHVKADSKEEYSKKARRLHQFKVPLGVIPMQSDCKIVRGKVPGPANHVLCFTHNHVVDLGTKTIIALSLEDYKRIYGKGK